MNSWGDMVPTVAFSVISLAGIIAGLIWSAKAEERDAFSGAFLGLVTAWIMSVGILVPIAVFLIAVYMK